MRCGTRDWTAAPLPGHCRPAARPSCPRGGVLTCDVPELQAHHRLRVPVEHLEREVHAYGGPVVRGKVLVHIAFDDAGLAHAQVADHQQLVQVLLVRGLHPGGQPACRAGLGSAAGAWAGDGLREHECGRQGEERRGGGEGRNSSPAAWRNAQTGAQGVNPPSFPAPPWRGVERLQEKARRGLQS